jgi:hypothetical protein
LRGAHRHDASTARSSPEAGRFVFDFSGQELNVAKCDVCGNETSRVKSPTYAPDEMRRVVANGFMPDEATLNRRQAEQNLSREALVSDWKRRVEQAQSDWLLCSDCAARSAVSPIGRGEETPAALAAVADRRSGVDRPGADH